MKIERASERSPIAKLQREKRELLDRLDQSETDKKRLVQENKQLYKYIFFSELRHIIEIHWTKGTTVQDDVLLPPHIKANFDRHFEAGKSDYFIKVAKDIISSKPLMQPIIVGRSLSDSTYHSAIEHEESVEKPNETLRYSCGELF